MNQATEWTIGRIDGLLTQDKTRLDLRAFIITCPGDTLLEDPGIHSGFVRILHLLALRANDPTSVPLHLDFTLHHHFKGVLT